MGKVAKWRILCREAIESWLATSVGYEAVVSDDQSVV